MKIYGLLQSKKFQGKIDTGRVNKLGGSELSQPWDDVLLGHRSPFVGGE
jgi:hypothetical protein